MTHRSHYINLLLPVVNMQAPQNRRERERILRREAILDSAQKEFAEKGYARAKLEDIARRAEFGKGTLYNYFPGGKQGMLFASFDQLFEDSEILIQESFSEAVMQLKSFREAFYDYTLSCLSFYHDRKELFFILVKEAHRMCFGEDKQHVEYFRQKKDTIIEALAKPVEQAMQAGDLREMNPSAVAHMILGNIEGLQIHAIMEGELQNEKKPPSLEEAAQFLTTFLLDGLAIHTLPNEMLQPKDVSHNPSHVQT